MQSCSTWIAVQSTKAGVSFNSEQVAVAANEYVRLMLVQQLSNPFCITAWSSANVEHQELNPLDVPLQDLLSLAANDGIVDVPKNNTYGLADQFLHGINYIEVADITSMPQFIAITQMMTHSLVPMAVCV